MTILQGIRININIRDRDFTGKPQLFSGKTPISDTRNRCLVSLYFIISLIYHKLKLAIGQSALYWKLVLILCEVRS